MMQIGMKCFLDALKLVPVSASIAREPDNDSYLLYILHLILLSLGRTQYMNHCTFLEWVSEISYCWWWLMISVRYPLGRVIGGTVYPGLTLTAGTMWW